jgi:hypothetical protein
MSHEAPIAVPTVVDKTQTLPAVRGNGESRINLAYAYMLSDKAKEGTLTQTIPLGIKAGQFYMKDSLGVRRIDPFRIVATPHFWDGYIDQDDNNRIVAASFAEGPGLSQHRLALALAVEADDSAVTPILIPTNRAANRVWDNVSVALATAKKGSPWFLRGPAFAVTHKTDKPYFRVVSAISGRKEKSKSGGYDYWLGVSAPAPTSEKLIAVLEAFEKSQEAEDAFQAFVRKANWLSKLAEGVVKADEAQAEDPIEDVAF